MRLWIGAVVAVAIATTLMVGAAMGHDSRMFVPARPDPGSPRCVSGSVYGYTLEVCNGSYSVSGQNMTCHGPLSYIGDRDVTVTLHRGQCGRRGDWYADVIQCDGAREARSKAARLIGARCTYLPNADGRAAGFASTRVVFR
ncbi:MAG: hypothetical protein QNJ62_00790 [Methyloceanibacter sp.]|nr:hypothetical protein [Methyloceanibacter sp.]